SLYLIVSFDFIFPLAGVNMGSDGTRTDTST
ncbi:MAG: hypothetical protein QG602_2200, partial [Verrucomicrobiota bacterium]|nr:hypothetical protein [Verrucomicrobiota bacterium]